MNVLIAVDDSAESREAASAAYSYFGPDHDYSLLSVGRRKPVVYGTYPVGTHRSAADLLGLMEKSAAAEAMRAAKAASTELGNSAEDADLDVDIGDPGRVICRRATEGNAAVIVIGSHDKNFWERIIDPSVGRYLIDNAPCPVLVVR